MFGVSGSGVLGTSSLGSVAVAVVVVVVAVAGLVEERRVYLGQQHSENKVVVVAAIVKDSTI